MLPNCPGHSTTLLASSGLMALARGMGEADSKVRLDLCRYRGTSYQDCMPSPAWRCNGVEGAWWRSLSLAPQSLLRPRQRRPRIIVLHQVRLAARTEWWSRAANLLAAVLRILSVNNLAYMILSTQSDFDSTRRSLNRHFWPQKCGINELHCGVSYASG